MWLVVNGPWARPGRPDSRKGHLREDRHSAGRRPRPSSRRSRIRAPEVTTTPGSPVSPKQDPEVVVVVMLSTAAAAEATPRWPRKSSNSTSRYHAKTPKNPLLEVLQLLLLSGTLMISSSACWCSTPSTPPTTPPTTRNRPSSSSWVWSSSCWSPASTPTG